MFFGLRLIGRVIGFAVKAVVFVAAIGVVAGAVAYALFDGEQYKQRVSKRVLDLTGRAMTVNGKAELDLTLPPRIVLNDVRVKNARWGSRPDMARIRRVEIQLNPLKAISGGDSVAQIRLDGADVMLETNAQGIGNWELGGFAAGGSIGALGALSAFGLLGGSSSPPPVIVSNPTITFRDDRTGRQQTASLGGSSVEVTGGGAAVAGGGGAAGGAVAGGTAGGIGGLASLPGGAAGFAPEAAFAGGSESSHVLAAAGSDDTNPCDGSQRQPPQSQQAAKPR
ncbi:MAG TPA: AsmA family protein [Alphaproteobacteria bacterium]|nr:AsmA family protein [Alphaproteobacteria bacterium]